MSILEYLFVFPKFANGRSFEGFDYHLGSGFVRGVLREHGIRTEQFIHAGDQTLDRITERMLEREPVAVAFAVYDINYFFVKLLADRIRQRSPSTRIVCGGPTSTFSSEVMLADCPSIDVCVRSYGEYTALDLVFWMHGDRSLETIPGISYRVGAKILKTRERTLTESLGLQERRTKARDREKNALDRFPDPYLEGLIPLERISDIGMVTSRGCTYACTFCNFSAMSNRMISYHSIERVLEVMRFVEQEVASGRVKKDDGERKLIALNDDNFSLHPKRFQSIEFWAEMRTETMRDETFPVLKRASFGEINFGLESGVPHVLANIKKARASGWEKDDYRIERRFLERIAWAVKKGQESGIATSVSVILGNPGESYDDGLATLQFVESLNLDRYAHNFLSVLAGTELAATYQEFGIRVEPSPG